MDHLKTSEVFQDPSVSEPYIDFGKVFSTLQATSERLGAYPQTPGVTKEFTDNNQRVIDTTSAENDTQEVVLTLTDEKESRLMTVSTNFKIKRHIKRLMKRSQMMMDK